MDDKTRISPDPGAAVVGPGTQLSGIFELDEHIATGGMGEVYRGHNIETGDKVAIKIVLPEFARDPTILALFRKEASILNHLSHDAIVRYHVFTVDPRLGRPYMAMEFVDGDALFDVMQRGPMSKPDVWQLCHRLSQGLAAVHDAGAVHRDLSPDNVILPGGRVDRAKIIDFGIARSAHVGGETLIGGKFAGKYNFVSPEQLGLNGGQVSDKSDIYSLGLVLAAALRGKPLEMSGSQLEIIEKRRAVPDLAEIDEDFRSILGAMLQPDPKDRPSSAELAMLIGVGAFKSNVAASARGGGHDSHPPSGDGLKDSDDKPRFVPHRPPALSPKPRTAPAPARTSAQPRPAAGRRTGLFAAIAAVLVLGAAGAYLTGLVSFGTPRGEAEPETPTAVLTPAPADQAPADPGKPSDALSPAAETPPPAAAEPVNPDPDSAKPPSVSEPEAPASTEPPATVADEPVQPPAAPQSDTASKEEIAALPKTPEPVPPPTVDPVRAIAWIRDHQEGSCFYANAAVAEPGAVTISGLGTAAAPLDRMAAAFEDTFKLRPTLHMQVIEPTQCAVTDFLKAAPAGDLNQLRLTLEEAALSNGSPLAGALRTGGGPGTVLYLIDHKGMVFNLTERIDALSPEAAFSIPIALSAADNAAGRVAPQLLVAITGTRGIDAASFTRPTPAAELFPRIRGEIEAKGKALAATAQYFTLGQ
ncbi:serine/threonine-protein kinase [Mesorhizobium sp. J428]|uniref:serine/threonine-protein kinase n=1 Tax=Mesorhizobium sp. J428 TaxID=2898440 RepID=UPI002151AF94|nr:serine/threonine-protein kinase [Mesorhizobium sp. J428]MCR5856362.1 protein kinase [Mesorhizobium sp. J428]